MKCPICERELALDKDSGDYGCWNSACSMVLLGNLHIQFWQSLERNHSRFKVAPAAPRWRPFNLEEMRKSLPVVVTSKDGSMDYTLLIRSDAALDVKFRLGSWHKEDLVWLPVPKVEVVK